MTRLIDADAINPMRVPQSVKEMRAWIESADSRCGACQAREVEYEKRSVWILW